MYVKNSENNLSEALRYIPMDIASEIRSLLNKTGYSERNVSEIRLRLNGACAAVIGGKNVALGISLSEDGMRETFKRISGGALFAHLDDVKRGFIALPSGIRVGVAGRARYDSGDVVGICDVSSLVFRIPQGRCSFATELYGEWLLFGGGMLICSRAGEGKTTVIRALARLIGSGEGPRRVVVVDERCELDSRDYLGTHVDILAGYRRALGVDIAIRTMSAEVLMVDEISSMEDSRAMLAALGAGVSVIATAHATSLATACRRDYVRELIEGGLFERVCIIERSGDKFSYKLERVTPCAEKLHGMGDI